MTDNASLPHPYLNTPQAAKLLSLSIRTLERMRVDGTGPRFMKAGRGQRSRALYKAEDIHAWLEEQAFSSTSQYCA